MAYYRSDPVKEAREQSLFFHILFDKKLAVLVILDICVIGSWRPNYDKHKVLYNSVMSNDASMKRLGNKIKSTLSICVTSCINGVTPGHICV